MNNTTTTNSKNEIWKDKATRRVNIDLRLRPLASVLLADFSYTREDWYQWVATEQGIKLMRWVKNYKGDKAAGLR